MEFHSSKFLTFFLIVFGVYWSLPSLGGVLARHPLFQAVSWHRVRMAWLLAASCYFYISWNPYLISLILFSASVDFFAARKLERLSSPRLRRLLLVGSISINLGLLAFFKYFNFFLDNACTALNLFGWETPPHTLQLILPLGISFYTFETISYIFDVYRGKARAVQNYLDYALYIMFFPHLIAGPIVRPRDFLPQIGQRKRFNWDRAQYGVQLFLVGLFKKGVVANHLAHVVDPVFENPATFGSGAVWLAVLSYAAQIYCDFSGYSDMALGTAHLLGFKLPRNFRMPYFAADIGEFWRRWHISLSSWLRDYVYIPLGGNRGGTAKTYRNLLLTMLLGGLWHGANWTFVAWGLYHGLLLALHRALPRPAWWTRPIFRPLAVAFTFLCVCVGWVFFRAQTFNDAAIVLGAMFRPVAGTAADPTLAGVAMSLLLLVLLCHLIGTFVNLRHLERRLPASALGTLLALLLVAALLLLPEDGRGFIYFQF
jgi:alginate O-acetyltransferase complex protein AlgI